VFESEMHDALLKRAELETDLRRAVERSEFVIHYQPIMDLKSDLIMGMEALVRWNHPQHGLLGPDEFISIAEETNLIEPLGRWILEEACCQAHIWRTRFGYDEALSITVNISSRQFQDDTLVDTVAAALEKSGLSPDGLILEITESTMLRSTDDTITKLHELKALGVRLAIDDFGTGYSSLSYLQRFPVDVLKIDKSFIAKICQGTEGAAVARAIIMMSDTLHLNTIAEGIESPNQITALQELGCGLGQGFHFARPLDVDAMSSFLKTTREKPKSWILQEIGSDVVSDVVQ
jgi:EAL domain-containing protein (putative c-di-GMP-specific phosphodiesterase class I)